MAQSRIDIVINTLFNQKGMKQVGLALDSLRQKTSKIQAAFNAADKILSARALQGKMKKVGISASSLNKNFGGSVKKIVDFKLGAKQAEEQAKLLSERQKVLNAEATAGGKIMNRLFKGDLNLAKSTEPVVSGFTNINTVMKGFDKGIPVSKLGQFVDGIRAASPNVNIIAESMKGAKTKAERFGRGLAAWSNSFSAWALSVTFFGMAIKATFATIATTSVRTFLKIIQANDMQSTSLQQLNAHWMFLKFTIGHVINDVLGPMLPRIYEIIEGIRNWVTEHPILFVELLKLGFILGLIFFLIGSVTLGIKGVIAVIISWISWIKYIKNTKFGKKIKDWISSLKILKKQSLKDFFTGLITKLKSFTKALWKNITAVWSAVAPWLAIVGIVVLTIALFISLEATWKQIAEGYILKLQLMGSYFKTFYLQLKKGWENIKYISKVVIESIKIIFMTVINAIISGFENAFQGIIDIINWIINTAHKFKIFTDVSTMDDISLARLDVEGAKAELETTLTEWSSTIGIIDKQQEKLVSERRDIFEAAAKNEIKATENFKQAWSEVFDAVKDRFESIKSSLSFDTSNVAPKASIASQSNTTSTTITNNYAISPELKIESGFSVDETKERELVANVCDTLMEDLKAYTGTIRGT